MRQPYLFSKRSIVAGKGFDRRRIALAAIATHLSIGSVYAWSVFIPYLTRELGVVSPAADDWSLSSIMWVFSIAIVFLGLTASFANKWMENSGPRITGFIAAFCWGGGMIIGSIGISSHHLSLLCLGYGVLGGCGLGLSYSSPVSILRQWFPDQRNVATAMAIMGFGGGAVIAVPMINALASFYAQPPEYLGAENTLNLILQEGRLFLNQQNQMLEVVIASAAQAAQLPGGGLPGAYLAGTGNTGMANAFMTLGILYFLIMTWAAFLYRLPEKGWRPLGWAPIPEDISKGIITDASATVDEILNTRQFWQFWLILCFNITAGISIISIAATMIMDIYSYKIPNVVTTSFASIYVLMISIVNTLGRFFWTSISEAIGQKNTYSCFFLLGGLSFLCIPLLVTANFLPPMFSLIGFYAVTMFIFTIYGGGFATVASYLTHMFGVKHVTSLHRTMLTSWSVAGILGPLGIVWLRQDSLNRAIKELITQIDPELFMEKFGAPVNELETLLKAKTVTISRLMEIVPTNTPDPTAALYNSSMFTIIALLVIAFCVNLTIRPVTRKSCFIPEP